MPVNGDKPPAQLTSVFRLASPPLPNAASSSRIRRRTRKIISCLPCRARKLKCDRKQPCEACVKRHHPERCVFADAPDQGAPEDDNEALRARLKMLEDLVSRLTDSSQSQSPAAAETLKAAVCEEATQTTTTTTTTTVEEAPPANQRQQQPAREGEPGTFIDHVVQHLPPRAECDLILSAYFAQRHLVPAVFHAGQFQRLYEAFWEQPSATSPLWLSILFALISTSFYQKAAKMSSNAHDDTKLADETRKRIDDCSAMAHQCLVAGNHLEGGPFAVEATLIFGMHLVLQKRDSDPQCWHMIGTAVRLAQRAGYHRDANKLGRGTDGGGGLTPFEAEMRRRTWSYLEYFDVHFSFQLGVPPIINVDFVDTAVPTNLRDDDFDEASTALPPPRPPTEMTPILAYVHSSKQVKLLHRVVHQALAVRQPSYAEVMHLHDDVAALHARVPPGLRWRPVCETGLADIPDVILRRMTAETNHLKALCILHRRYLTFGRHIETYERSRKACLDAALRLLDLQVEFDEHSRESGRLYERRYLVTNLGYHGFLLAAMCICLDLTAGSRDGKVHDPEPKIAALKRAHTIWTRVSSQSAHAAHAADVLGQIIAWVPSLSPEEHEIARAGRRRLLPIPFAAAVPAPTSQQRPAPAPAPAAVDVPNGGPSSSAAAKGWSREWDFGRWDELGGPVLGAMDHRSSAAAAMDVDWNQVDSFLFVRTSSKDGWTDAAAPASASTRQQGSDAETPGHVRDTLPYPRWYEQVDERLRVGTPPPARSWTFSNITMAGIGPLPL